ncbi:MAG: VanZ family protein [Clostridium sp.]
MYYIKLLLENLPLIIFIGTIGFSGIYLCLHKILKMKFRGRVHIMFTYLFSLYIGLIIYVTFFSARYSLNGGVYNINSNPFDWVYSTYTLGISQGIKQFVLNIIMFIPFGIFIPLILSRINSLKYIFLVSIISVSIIEGLQLTVGRIFDIDDIIANTLGAVIGYCLYTIIKGIVGRILNKDKYKISMKKSFGYASLVIVIIFIPLGFELKDKLSEYGNPIVDGFSINENTNIKVNINKIKGREIVYTIANKSTPQEVLNTLKSVYKIQNQQVSTGGLEGCFISDDKYFLSVDKDLIWSYQVNDSTNSGHAISKSKAKSIGNTHLKRLGLNQNNFKITDISEDDLKRISIVYEFRDFKTNLKYGNIILSINSGGEVVNVNSNLKDIAQYKIVNTMSEEEAINRAKKNRLSPNEYFNGEVSDITITNIGKDYIFEGRKGHLQPGFKISGTAVVNGKPREFQFIIPSIKEFF